MFKNKKVIIISLIIIITIIVGIFIKFNNKMAKNNKIGNNSSSQEIVDYILNISSYETIADITVDSNKNSNKYKIKQQYIESGIMMQEVLEPSNIAGVKIIKDGNNLKLENTNLNLTNIYENYQEVVENDLDLITFIKDYKDNEKGRIEEKENKIILKVSNRTNEKNKTLYIDRSTGKPLSMEIKYNNKKNTIYIIYNEVSINSFK